MPAPDLILDLIERFERNRGAYRSAQYNESQLRRYAWSARPPLSILTDFEEFAVYDCQGKPDKSDKASTGRVLYFDYRHYPERWDEIAEIIQRQSILKGSFDRSAAATRTPQEMTALQPQLETTDCQIDALVYELYGLSEAEIAIVEGRVER